MAVAPERRLLDWPLPLSGFASRLAVTPQGERRWELIEDVVHAQGDGTRITVKQGTPTDFASVPRLFWAIFPPYGRYTMAAVFHDELYRLRGRIPDEDAAGGYRTLTRKECDKLFLAEMIVDGTKVIRALVMYRAVRWFGWIAWRKAGRRTA